MEDTLTRYFDWINTVHIRSIRGSKPKVVLNLDVKEEFQEATPSFQHSSIYELMQTAASSVGWDMQRTALDFNGHLAQPLTDSERKL
jgi:hypothetical protein